MDLRVDVADGTAASGLEVRNHFLDHVECAEEVHFERAAPVVEVRVLEQRERTGVVRAVDQRVDATESLDRGIDEALACRAVGDVGGEREHVAALGLDLGGDPCELGFAATADSDARPFAREGEGQFLAEARADSGDDGNLVLEQHGV